MKLDCGKYFILFVFDIISIAMMRLWSDIVSPLLLPSPPLLLSSIRLSSPVFYSHPLFSSLFSPFYPLFSPLLPHLAHSLFSTPPPISTALYPIFLLSSSTTSYSFNFFSSLLFNSTLSYFFSFLSSSTDKLRILPIITFRHLNRQQKSNFWEY